ncbi:malate dehydrogenase, glyoxysomal-like isoform X1 [Salvia splendens]|uniref:malate dehydrogenase, glyoxysomal-like isoform X1 n=2 Tax=Salvia splendens TaxID=180675 RepID=UPI001C255CF2|nr:malate dehydrogenase, glyoxysomal-like isoform X1 [Salvia splendens]
MLDVVRANTFVAEFWDLILERLVFLLLVGMLEHNSAPSLTGEASLPIDTGGDKFLNQANSRWWDRSGSGKSRSRLSNSINVKFADACLHGLREDAGIFECAFVASQFAGNEPPVLRNQGGLGAEELRRFTI